MTTIIAVTGGKGGVGKTNISLNLALEMARAGIRTCLFDADLGPANINRLINHSPGQTLEDVMENRLELDGIVFKDYQGIDIVPGSAGIRRMAGLDEKEIPFLIQTLSLLARYDCLILDTAVGVARNVISLCLAAPHVLLILTPESGSLTDEYALLKNLAVNGFGGKVHVVVNRATPRARGEVVFDQFKKAVDKHLNLELLFLGAVPDDPRVNLAVREQWPFLLRDPSSPASEGIQALATACQGGMGEPAPESVKCFWEGYFQALKGPLRTVRKKKQGNAPNAREKHRAERHPPLELTDPVPESLEASLLREKDMAGLLAEIVTGIVSISRELRGLRETTDFMVRKVKESPASAHSPDQGKPPVINLDFEAYRDSVQDRSGA
ncbi:MAG: MinD/ParA family protein [Desulfobacteraceae bacterium]|nr:MinD/ParA family protein [Desulfobacteraceae bacterium]